MPSIDARMGYKTETLIEPDFFSQIYNFFIEIANWIEQAISSIFSSNTPSPTKPLDPVRVKREILPIPTPKPGTFINYQGQSLRINEQGIGELVVQDRNGNWVVDNRFLPKN